MNKLFAFAIAMILPIILIFGFVFSSHAGWAAFHRITPENIHEQMFRFSFSRIGVSEKFKVILDDRAVNNRIRGDFDVGKFAWLVITKTPLSENEQNLQEYFEGLQQLKYDSKILLTSKIGYSQNEANKPLLEVTFSKEQLNTAYIFVGYDRGVNDGGLRYTIDLNSFYLDNRLRRPKSFE